MGFIGYWVGGDKGPREDRMAIYDPPEYTAPMEYQVDQDPKLFETGAKRSKELIPAYSLIPPSALRRLAFIYKEGADKYNPGNWQKGMPFREIIDHLLAHLFKWMIGDRSEDHLAKAAWGLFALMYFEEANPSLSDLTFGEGDPNAARADGDPYAVRTDGGPGWPKDVRLG